MSETASRLDHFKKMAEADPSNELGHFSLARAYLEAGQAEDAAKSFDRAIELNAKLSKAYQLAAQAYLESGKQAIAIERLTAGVKVADERGDLMPRNDMTRMLKELGAAVPELRAKAAVIAGEGEVLCNRCGLVKKKLPRQPMSNAQGKLIYDKICNDCWREWIGMGTKVINELRLPLADPQAQKIYDQHMMEFLNLQQ
jgi:Fe-S cluster biosynthesis and repair protein YggX